MLTIVGLLFRRKIDEKKNEENYNSTIVWRFHLTFVITIEQFILTVTAQQQHQQALNADSFTKLDY